MTTVVARAMKTPARHTGCGKKEQPVRRSPMRNAALRRARFVVPRRRPRRPRHRPRQQSCHVLCSMPRRSLPTRCRRDAPTRRHMHRPGRPGQAGAGSPRLRRASTVSSIRLRLRRRRDKSLDFFESLTSSPQALSTAAVTALRAVHPATGGQASRPQRDSSNSLPVLFPSTTTPAPSGRSRTGSTSSATPLPLRRRHIHTRAPLGYFRRLLRSRSNNQILRFRLRVFWYCYR